MGLFQNCHGKFDIDVIGVDIITIEKRLLHPLQKRYQMESGYDEDFVICPTLQSIVTGKVPFAFRVNHSKLHFTHRLVWVQSQLDYPDSHYVLKAVDPVLPHTEITFDYNYGSVA